MSKREVYEQKTEEILLPILEKHGFELWDVEYVKEGSNWYLRAYIDKPGGIMVDDCEVVSRELSDILDEKDFIDEAYILEISSPGLGRPLKKERDFERSLGEEVEIRTYRAIDGQKEFLGILKSYDKDTVNFFVLQKLNPDMVKLTSFGSKQQFGASFNMVIFLQPAYDVSQYPKFIQDAWEEMLTTGVVTMDKKGKVKFNPRAKLPAGHILENKNGNYMYWVPLPQDLC